MFILRFFGTPIAEVISYLLFYHPFVFSSRLNLALGLSDCSFKQNFDYILVLWLISMLYFRYRFFLLIPTSDLFFVLFCFVWWHYVFVWPCTARSQTSGWLTSSADISSMSATSRVLQWTSTHSEMSRSLFICPPQFSLVWH